ncbi:hypothetical protein [Flavobacterium sp. N2038]|uniref:hypothetical protein n=1 Tax=Flavobacterium sp. N2038 TaxID=2986829 RepID=UPI0022241D79|nr:hypothetical protein [Flavobacterium sp. N2038]
MNKFNLFLKVNLVRIIKIEILVFLFFIFLAIVYGFYESSHKYFNNVDFPLNLEGISAFLITLLYGFFFFLIIVFPFAFFLQLFLGVKYKILDKSKIVIVFLLAVLYFGVTISVFSLYSIKQHQNFISRKIEGNEKE